MAVTWIDYTIVPLLIPFILVYWCIAFLLSWVITCTILPSLFLAKRMREALPFLPYIWQQFGRFETIVRLGFEASYCINVCTRLLTLPMRPYLPSFYIIGFPKCGTTSLAEHLRRHPALSGIVGLPYHETLNKESHYFTGILGRSCAQSSLLYRSFFPIILHRWWAEVVLGVEKWMCFDACPVFACLPYVAARMARVTPSAKIVVMLRDPVAGVFSAERMLRGVGVPLAWTLEKEASDSNSLSFQISKDDMEAWSKLKVLGPCDPLPVDMANDFYFKFSSILHSGHYAELLDPYMKHFGPESILVVNFNDFINNTESVVRQVLHFVGADPELLPFKKLPPSMQNNYVGHKMHPSVRAQLKAYYHPYNLRLCSMLQREFGWEDMEMNMEKHMEMNMEMGVDGTN